MGLISDLGRGPTALDTVAFIYFIEENPKFLPLLEPLFEQVDGGRREIVTSSVTLLEVPSYQPLASKSDRERYAEEIERLILEGIEVLRPTLQIERSGWGDSAHMNAVGAAQFTPWVRDALLSGVR